MDSSTVALGTFTVVAPTVSGTAEVGEQLSCAAPAGPGTVAHEWLRDGDQVGTGATYVAQPADLGDAVTCRITVSRTGYTDATSQADSDTIEAGTFTVGAPVITGQPQVGQILTCAVPTGTPGSADSLLGCAAPRRSALVRRTSWTRPTWRRCCASSPP